jgi:hypothetical protein
MNSHSDKKRGRDKEKRRQGDMMFFSSFPACDVCGGY